MHRCIEVLNIFPQNFQREKSEFLTNFWTFKDVLVRLLDIISHPIKSKIENIYNRSNQYVISFNKRINQKLIDNCCHLLARVLAEIVYQSCASDVSWIGFRQRQTVKRHAHWCYIFRMNYHFLRRERCTVPAVVSRAVTRVAHGTPAISDPMQFRSVSIVRESQ